MASRAKKQDKADGGLRWGEGFVEKRERADGSIRHVARWYEGEKLKAKSFRSEEEATAHLIDIGAAKRTNRYRPTSDLTIEDLVTEYMGSPARTWSPNTRGTYEVYRDRLLYPTLRHQKAVDLTPRMVQSWADTLHRDGKSSSAIANTLSLLSAALKDAVRLDILPRNVAAGTRIAPRPDLPYRTWSEDQVRTVLNHVRDDVFLYPLYGLAIATGMRPGELRGLCWDCVDAAGCLIAIRRTITRDVDHKDYLGTTTKTRRNRVVMVPAEVMVAIDSWRTLQRERRRRHAAWQDLGIVFDRGDGRWLPPETFQIIHDRVCEEAKVTRIRLHDIRHSFATLAFAAGEHPKVVTEILGHKSVAFTLDRYTHMTVADQRGSTDRIARHFFSIDVEEPNETALELDDGNEP